MNENQKSMKATKSHKYPMVAPLNPMMHIELQIKHIFTNPNIVEYGKNMPINTITIYQPETAPNIPHDAKCSYF